MSNGAPELVRPQLFLCGRRLTHMTVPNGGYTASSFLITARIHMRTTHPGRKHNDPINFHVQFIRRTRAGPAFFSVHDIKLGSRISVLHLTLSQPESSPRSLVEGYVSLTNIASEFGLSITTLYRPSPIIISLLTTATDADSKCSYILRGAEPFADFRRAAANVQMYLLKSSLRAARPWSMSDQWIRLKGGRWTNDALGFLVDMFPQVIEGFVNPEVELDGTGPPIQNHRPLHPNAERRTYWYPTLTLTVDVKKALPEEGVEFVFVRVKAKRVESGRFDLDVEVWDEGGDLVAVGYHTGLVMGTERNEKVKKRRVGREGKL
jgi:hypothetical protein